MGNGADGFDALAQKDARPVFKYKIPPKFANGVTSVGFIQLTAREEMMASKRGGMDPMKIIYEQVLQSLVMINDAPVSNADGSADKVFNEMHPAVRQMVTTAYQRLHNPPEGDMDAFLASQEIKVG